MDFSWQRSGFCRSELHVVRLLFYQMTAEILLLSRPGILLRHTRNINDLPLCYELIHLMDCQRIEMLI